MKNFFYIVLFSALIAGCNSNSATIAKESETAGNVNQAEMEWDTTGDVNVDTIGRAANLARKAARLREANRVNANSSTGGKEINLDTVGLAEFKRMRARTARQSIKVPAPQQEITLKSPKPDRTQNSTTKKKETVAQQSGSENKSTEDAAKSTEDAAKSTEDAAAAEQSADQTKEKKDVSKKTSNRTKGAIIGAVSGAAAGAVINKRNRKAGGIIGGILGGAAGYGIGRKKDKKDTTAKGGKQTTDNQY